MTRRVLSAVLAGVLIACEHSSPFSSGSGAATGTLAGGSPAQLTFNLGVDERVSWLPDGSAFFYTAERTDLPFHERCLALMPAQGGAVRSSLCAPLEASQDSQITFESPAVSSGNALAYLRAGSAHVGATGFDANALLLTSYLDPSATRLLLRTPFFGPGGQSIDNLSQLQWMGDTSLIALGELEVYPTCLGCLPDTVRSGLEIDRINVGPDSATVVGVPGTDSASSVAVGRGDTIYYTRNGGSQVYRQSLSVGIPELFRDYGPGVIVRDVRVAGSRYVAVTGGQITQFYPDSTYVSTLQRDHGGDLRLADTRAGTEILFTLRNAFVRRPVLSPDGHQVVFERYPYVINVIRGPGGAIVKIDTVVSRVGDLWSLQWP